MLKQLDRAVYKSLMGKKQRLLTVKSATTISKKFSFSYLDQRNFTDKTQPEKKKIQIVWIGRYITLVRSNIITVKIEFILLSIIQNFRKTNFGFSNFCADN